MSPLIYSENVKSYSKTLNILNLTRITIWSCSYLFFSLQREMAIAFAEYCCGHQMNAKFCISLITVFY